MDITEYPTTEIPYIMVMQDGDTLEDVNMVAELVHEHGESYAVYAGIVCDDAKDATAEAFTTAYQGIHPDRLAFTRYLFADSFDAQLENYIDFEGLADQLECDGYYFVDGTEGVHVYYTL